MSDDIERSDARLYRFIDKQCGSEFLKPWRPELEAIAMMSAAERERHAAEVKAQRIATTKAAAKWLRKHANDTELISDLDTYVAMRLRRIASELDAMADGLPG